jgi:ureidoglycolate hydrolase
MVDVIHVRAEPLTAAAFSPFGQVLARDPDRAIIGVRDGEEFALSILTYQHRGLRVDHLNAHHRATQALFPLGRSALLVVAPAGTTFGNRLGLDGVAAFVIDGTAGVNLAYGTWHWGPYPIHDEVSMVNLQGRNFVDDNEVAHLERDLGVVIEVVL